MSTSPILQPEDCRVLTPTQETVLSLISAGSTTVAAAEAAGVHRNTILNWRRSSAHFRAALCRAREEKVLFWRDQNEQLAAAAIDALRSILTDPSAPASVRLKAALHVLDRSCAPPIFTEEDEIARTIGNVQSRAQSAQSPQPHAPILTRPAVIGRNDCCPCGSGKKFKRCCIDKTNLGPVSLATEPAQLARMIAS
jgi:hypothetical protein